MVKVTSGVVSAVWEAFTRLGGPKRVGSFGMVFTNSECSISPDAFPNESIDFAFIDGKLVNQMGDLLLTKTDELDDADAAFRYKAHVGAGDYLDYEFHTEYYVLSGTTTEGEWNSFDYYDSQIYGITVIDMEEYGISLFDPSIV